MDKDFFKNHEDYWQVAKNTQGILLSEGSLLNLLDFERVLDEFDLYAFRNWKYGELVAGPDISKYTVSCVFMWPDKLMPDPRGGRRLMPFDVDMSFKRSRMKIPVKIQDPSDYRPGTHKAKIMERWVWLVEITMPKSLMDDIRTGSVELEDQTIDMQDLDDAYDEDLDQAQYQDIDNQQELTNYMTP